MLTCPHNLQFAFFELPIYCTISHFLNSEFTRMRLLPKLTILLILFSHVAHGTNSTTASNADCKCMRASECLLAMMNRDEVLEFRARLLDKTNEIRNNIAGGHGGPTRKKGIPTGSNMEVVNYDVGLEYNAACRALNCVSKVPHGCECTRSFPKGVCQVQWAPWMPGFKLRSFLMHYEQHITTMYQYEMPYIDEGIIANFKSSVKYPNIPIMMWSTVNRMGCALSVAPQQGNATAARLVCNYGSTYPYCNTPNTPIYKKGTMCSNCHNNLTCKTAEYNHLCGTLYSLPTDTLKLWVSEQQVEKVVADIKNVSNNLRSIRLLAALSIIFLLFQSLLTYLF